MRSIEETKKVLQWYAVQNHPSFSFFFLDSLLCSGLPSFGSFFEPGSFS